MTVCDKWDVVIVPFPFIDMPLRKPRPVLVLSPHMFNDENGHSILAMITTAAHSHWPSDCSIQDLDSAGLRARSIVRWKVFTLENMLIARRIGRLGEVDRGSMRDAMRACLI